MPYRSGSWTPSIPQGSWNVNKWGTCAWLTPCMYCTEDVLWRPVHWFVGCTRACRLYDASMKNWCLHVRRSFTFGCTCAAFGDEHIPQYVCGSWTDTAFKFAGVWLHRTHVETSAIWFPSIFHVSHYDCTTKNRSIWAHLSRKKHSRRIQTNQSFISNSEVHAQSPQTDSLKKLVCRHLTVHLSCSGSRVVRPGPLHIRRGCCCCVGVIFPNRKSVEWDQAWWLHRRLHMFFTCLSCQRLQKVCLWMKKTFLCDLEQF